MTNDEALALLSTRIDGPLSDEQQASLNAWIGESSDNLVLAEAFQTQHGELRMTFAPRREAVRETAAAVVRQLNDVPKPSPERQGRGWWRMLFTPLPAACAAAALLAIGLFTFRSGKVDPSPDASTVVLGGTDPYEELGLKARTRPDAPKSVAMGVGEAIKTEAGEKRRVTLPDGSLLYVNQGTQVTLAKNRQVKLISGDVFVEAVPAKSEGERFVVEAGDKSITALGTKFSVSATQAGTGVLVTQGKVEVSGVAEPITSGRLMAPGETKVTVAPRASAALNWTKDLMIAAESPLVPAGKHSGGSLVAVDPYGQEAKLSLTKFHVDVHIEDGFARTTIDQTYFNSENWRMEGTFYFPLPPDASLSRLCMYVDGDLMEGGMAEAGHARNVYETIRYQNRDPALLEWVDGSVFKMRVFPLEARQEKRIVLSYTQRLPVLYGQATYRFPAGHTLALVDKWSFNAVVKDGVATVPSSPSHPSMKFEHQGKDLTMHDEAKNAKVDRDVVLTLFDPKSQEQPEAVRWSDAELDGQKYLMVRYRPDLPTAPRRERRDWVFLFESSGGRDPLVARAQVEVIRSLLTHAEHDDTFSVVSIGTRVRKWKDSPEPANTENLASAMKWLEARHLIGALNLDQALSDVTPMLQSGSNPHLVHVGGGIASIGEQRADELIKRIPTGTKYVGIAVGKRFSPAFMKVAAERTGGLFAQVNPDEPIGWRGFEIASTLNAPRMLNVRVETPTAKFLMFTNVLAHGEELAAVANVTNGMPSTITVHGILDGQPVAKTIPVSNVAHKAGYLPRTWAKLEIDRLLAENSTANRKAITDLSKAMYVMTPFTSLLVLENEQMYKDFKVDRGRKDHWAMYPCPQKIPVVYIPDPNQPAGSRPDLKGQKPHENAVMQTVTVRNTPGYLTWPGQQRQDTPVETSGQRHGNFFALPIGGEVDGESVRLAVEYSTESGKKFADAQEFRQIRIPTSAFRRSGRGEEFEEAGLRLAAGDPMFDSPPSRTLSRPGRNLLDSTSGGRSVNNPILADDIPVSLDRYIRDAESAGLRDGSVNALIDGKRLQELGLLNGDSDFDGIRQKERRAKLGRASLLRNRGGESDARFDQSLMFSMEPWFNDLGPKDRLSLASDASYGLSGGQAFGKSRGTSPAFGEELAKAVSRNSAPSYYGRPSFNNNLRVFTDLASYAPGMSSSLADVQAVVDAEAAPRFGQRLGKIDPAARTLIEAARSAEWKSIKLGDTTFVHDGQGRYAYKRTVGLNLQEQVVCDGTRLLHLYPELGIAAERVVTRFHREWLLDVIPDFVPPADDLAHGCDVNLVDGKTVAIVPLRPVTEEKPPSNWLELHLTFDGDRLAERRWVLMPAKDAIIREVYSSKSTQLFLDKGKPPTVTNREASSAAAPNLTPDVSKLVTLPLPLRSREHVYREYGLDPNYDLWHDRNMHFECLDDDAIRHLFAASFSVNHGSDLERLWRMAIDPRGDSRIGYFTLMASANVNPRGFSEFNERFENQPSDPLVRYLWQMYDGELHNMNALFGFGPGGNWDSFLGKLTAFRRIQSRWQGSFIQHGYWGQRDGERERAIAFAVKNSDNVLGWCTLSMVQDQCADAAAWKSVAAAWPVLAEKSALRYPALYEEARALGNARMSEQAQTKFQSLFRTALNDGVLPPLDASFRNVLESGKQDSWAKLMRETAAKCAEKKARPVIVTLAWQCYQLGDMAMSDSLLELALKDVPATEKPFTMLAAVRFLKDTSRYDRADTLIRELLNDGKLAKSAMLWRLAGQVAEGRSDSVRHIHCLEKALDIEFERMPDVYDVMPIRHEYNVLLTHYDWLANASRSLNVDPPKDLVARIIKATDRWRHLDSEAGDVPTRAAAILRNAGGEGANELAWDYATTPLALKPNESAPWVSLAWSVRQEGNWRLADKCYEYAFAAEPTNAQLLWDRAQHLHHQGQEAERRKLLEQLAKGEWQPRFSGLKAQAKQALEGR